VESFAREVSELARFRGLHILVLNAGVTGVGWLELRTGVHTGQELRFATNHLGHFHLQLRPPARSRRRLTVQQVQPRAARRAPRCLAIRVDAGVVVAPFFFRDLQLYALSKLCNIMFAKELARRWGPEVLAVSLHPGSSMLTNGGESAWLPRLAPTRIALDEDHCPRREYSSFRCCREGNCWGRLFERLLCIFGSAP